MKSCTTLRNYFMGIPGNLVVSELNASVLTATFPEKSGTFKADLYKCSGSADCLVYHNSCGPIHGEFIETVLITI